MSLATDPEFLSSCADRRDRHGEVDRSIACSTCGFALWIPIASLEVSDVGLYNDARFPGRLLVSLREHHDHLDEVPDTESAAFLRDVRLCSAVLRRSLGALRVNFAILGNQEPHVHAHLIPRNPRDEPLPSHAPWQDPRPRMDMPSPQCGQILDRLTAALASA